MAIDRDSRGAANIYGAAQTPTMGAVGRGEFNVSSPVVAAQLPKTTNPINTATVVSTYTDPNTGDVVAVYSDGSTSILTKGTKSIDAANATKTNAAALAAKGQSAFDVFRNILKQYGIETLASEVEKYKIEGLSDAELFVKLRTESDSYKKRFAANEQRLKKGLRALSEAEYIALEDTYQEKMRQYGMPEAYYSRGELGRQEGFEKLIANGISASELEDRLQTALNRVVNASPEVTTALKQFYPDISRSDMLAYALDPDNAILNIKRKVAAAEIGGAAIRAGLTTDLTRAEQLRAANIGAEQAALGYQQIAAELPRGEQLASFYKQEPYTQAVAETAQFGLAGSVEAKRKRQKLSELERASFSGQTGLSQGALARDRAGSF